MWLWLLATALAAEPAATEAAVVEGLLPRHDPVACDALAPEATEAERMAALVSVAETVTAPPWVGMRAASCVAAAADRDPVALGAAETWLADPSTSGLARVVLGRLDDLDETTAVRLARGVISRSRTDARFALYARSTLHDSRHEALRSLEDDVEKPAAER